MIGLSNIERKVQLHFRMSHSYLFTSESVTEGHPDKLCDIVSDTILDACLAQDPASKVACETCAKTGFLGILGEITTNAHLDYEHLVRNAVREIGYTHEEDGFAADNFTFLNVVSKQSADIADLVYVNKKEEDLGAGDQGLMFGYATNETPELMPLTHMLAQRLAKRLTDVRKDGTLTYLRPDGKTQVTVEYERNGGHLKPKRIVEIFISAMHTHEVTLEQLREDIKKHVIEPIVPKELVTPETRFLVNAAGQFVIGGPKGDAGLTGRKIIVDGYGGWGAHGGGAFSGKDPSKVDRSACYAARWVAKSIVAAGLAERVLVQLSYGIGIAEPRSISIDSYGTGDDVKILEIVKKNFDLRPFAIIRDLDLKRPIYAQTAAYGHFGRHDIDLPWEQPRKLEM